MSASLLENHLRRESSPDRVWNTARHRIDRLDDRRRGRAETEIAACQENSMGEWAKYREAPKRSRKVAPLVRRKVS